jgi:WD40 repeat protein
MNGLVELFSVPGRGILSTRLAWSRDGKWLAVPHLHGYVSVIDFEQRERKSISVRPQESTDEVPLGHWFGPWCVAWTPDGNLAIGGGDRNSVQFRDPSTRSRLREVELSGTAHEIEFSPDGSLLAAASTDGTVYLWDYPQLNVVQIFRGHMGPVRTISWDSSGQRLASGGKDGKIVLWSPEKSVPAGVLEGHANFVNHIAWNPPGTMLASASRDRTVGLWDPQNGRLLHSLEGHKGAVSHVSFSPDGRLLVSTGQYGVIRFWRASNGTPLDTSINVRPSNSKSNRGLSIAFHPRESYIATPGPESLVRVWAYDSAAIWSLTRSDAVQYTSARVILVGDSGVGKTGLGWRIAHGAFKEQQSTHGQQFWQVDQLRRHRSDGTDCEVVLWDWPANRITELSTHFFWRRRT